MGGIRYEAWTLPWDSSGFQRKVASIPVPEGEGSGTVGYNGRGTDGRLAVASDYSRIDDIISTTSGSLIRVYDGSNLIDEWIAERVARNVRDTDLIRISGAALNSQDFFDRYIVFPYDYATSPSAFPNHIYGGRNRVKNPTGTGEPTNEKQRLTFTMESPEHTHLDGAINDSVTTVTVDDATIFSINDFCIVGDERMKITGISGSDLTVTRGEAGTTAAAHSDFDNIHRTAGGTFTVTYSGQTTAAQDFNPAGTAGNDTDAADLESALEALSNVTTVIVEKVNTEQATTSPDHAGILSSDKVWFKTTYDIEFEDPSGDIEQVTVADSVTGAAISVETTLDGSQGPAQNWTAAIDPITSQEIGEYSGVPVTGVASPTDSIKVTAASRYAGAQQVVKVSPGGVVQASIDVYPNVTADFVLSLRNTSGALISATAPTEATADQDNALTLSNVSIPADVEEIIFRIQLVDTDSSTWTTFYFNDPVVEEGLGASKWGKIERDLMDDAAVDHSGDTRGTPLDWVDYSGHTDTLDEESNAWPRDEALTVFRGMTYGRLFDLGVDLGYEWRLVAKSAAAEVTAGNPTHDLEWYIADGLGTDHTSSATPAINVGQSVIDGPVVSRIPDFTAVLVEGAEGVYVEDSDATRLSNFGRFERYFGDRSLADSGSLTAVGDDLLDEEDENAVAVKIRIVRDDASPVPLVDYSPGDLLYVQLPPALSKTTRRVRTISYTNDDPAVYDVTASNIFEPEAAQAEAVRQLLRKFDPLDDLGIQDVNLFQPVAVAASGSGEVTAGATILMSRVTNQSIDPSGDVVQWTTAGERYDFDDPPLPALAIVVKKQGYYDIDVHLEWDTFDDGGTVVLIRERGGADTQVWPPTGLGDLWSDTDGRVFEGHAPMIHLEPGDQVRLELSHGDASAQNLKYGTMAIELVDFAPFRLNDPRLGIEFGADMDNGVTTGSGTSVTMPADAVVGDWLLVTTRGTSGFYAHSDPATGWTEVEGQDWANGSPMGFSAHIRRVQSGDTGPWTFNPWRTPTSQTWRCEIIRGPGPTLHNDSDAGQSAQNVTSITSGSVTTLGGGVTYVAVAAKGGESSTDTVPTGSAGDVFEHHDTDPNAYDLRYSIRHESSEFSGTVNWDDFPGTSDLGIFVLCINPEE